MPWWLRPTAVQITVPHAAWIDNVPWYVQSGESSSENPLSYYFLPRFNSIHSSYIITPLGRKEKHVDKIAHLEKKHIKRPRVRDKLIEKPEKYTYSFFASLYTECFNVGWPYGVMDAVIDTGNDITLNPIFKKHVRKLSNYMVSRRFQEYLPEMTAIIYSDE